MNIDDFKNVELPADGNTIQAIFDKQEFLIAKYEPMEARNGAIVPERPWHIDDKFVQMRIKDMFWRFTEEICEAIEFDETTNLNSWKTRWDHDHHLRHFFEEMVDALHFLVEASIIAGLEVASIRDLYSMVLQSNGLKDPASVAMPTSQLRARCMALIKPMGLAANCLKNKPWKNTHMATDQAKFKSLMYDIWQEYFMLMADLGMGPNDLYVLYVKKNEVNKFRQNSNY